MIGAYKGYKVKLCLPENASHERKNMLRAYGAEMVFRIRRKGRMARSDCAARFTRRIPSSIFIPISTTIPPIGRRISTGPGLEILAQTEGRITHFVACMGTSGTFMGTSRRLRREMPGVKCISAQPSSGFHGLEGLKHMPTAIVPGIYDPELADENVWIETEDAYAMVRRLARDEALLVGISSGR